MIWWFIDNKRQVSATNLKEFNERIGTNLFAEQIQKRKKKKKKITDLNQNPNHYFSKPSLLNQVSTEFVNVLIDQWFNKTVFSNKD